MTTDTKTKSNGKVATAVDMPPERRWRIELSYEHVNVLWHVLRGLLGIIPQGKKKSPTGETTDTRRLARLVKQIEYDNREEWQDNVADAKEEVAELQMKLNDPDEDVSHGDIKDARAKMKKLQAEGRTLHVCWVTHQSYQFGHKMLGKVNCWGDTEIDADHICTEFRVALEPWAETDDLGFPPEYDDEPTDDDDEGDDDDDGTA